MASRWLGVQTTDMVCPRCGKENPEGARFCLECGSALGELPRGRREERKVVTVVFADLVGFTSQAERMDPEEVRAVLQPYHTSVRADLERYGGTVEKFIGDAVMALFGAPVAHEDDPERAVRAALAIRDTLKADGRLHVRIGVTTGEALVAIDARPESGEGMAAGDVVNTAARLQGEAPTDGILVDESTYRATSRAIDYQRHAAVTVKGKSEPIPVWEAVSARARFGVDVRQVGQAPLVGRLRELELLAGALARAKTEREPQLVTLVGVPGIGKSRLVWELFQQVDAGTDLVAWRQGRSLPYAEGVSFWALGEIIKAEAGILETDSADETAAKLARTIGALAEEPSDADWIQRHLSPLVGLEAATELRGDHRGEAFAAWRRFLEALADQRPLVVVFEDLHWADDGLLDFVDHLVDWATGVRLLIVGTSRPELLTRRPGWGGGKPNALTISLSPLSDAETQSLVGALVEQAIIGVSMREAVLERAQGNPLYAEEFARLLAEGGRLDELPESVQGIIAARLDGLTRDEKELLQDAAVVGKVFWSGALVQMGGRPRADVDERLHALERKEFVRRERRSSLAGETEYAFRHILVRDVAYGQIPRGERGERHALAAAWIESLGRPADHAELLAQHYLSAIDLARAAGRPTDAYADRARVALREAGDRATSLNAFGPAARYYRAALDLMPADDPVRPAVLFRYGKALRISEETGGDVLREAEDALRAAGDLDTAAEAAVLQGDLTWFAGDGPRTTEHLARAAGLIEDRPPTFSKAFVLSELSRFHMLAGRSEQAITLGRQALGIAEDLDLDEVRIHALNNVGTARVNLGDRGGVADLEAAVAIGEAISSPEVARAMNNLAVAFENLGEHQRARPLFRQAGARALEFGNAAVARFSKALLPIFDFDDGAWDEALPSLDAFIAEAERAGGHTLEPNLRVYRARIRYARGDLEGALNDAESALVAARRAGDPQVLVPALSFRAWLSARIGSQDEADPLLAEAIEQATGAFEPDIVELVLTLLGLGRNADVARVAALMPATPWKDLFSLMADGRLTEAATVCDELGLRPAVALIRFEAAKRLAQDGRVEDAKQQLARAVEFWRFVRATHFIEETEALRVRLDAAEGKPERTASR